MSQGESRLSRAIMNRLRAMGVFCFKIHGGPTMAAGLPDIIACVPVEVYYEDRVMGMFVGFETKTPTGGDPTPVQQHVHLKIGDAHGQVFVVRSVEDAVTALGTIGYTDSR